MADSKIANSQYCFAKCHGLVLLLVKLIDTHSHIDLTQLIWPEAVRDRLKTA